MKYKEILRGIPASQGVAEGKVRIIDSYEESKNFAIEKGDIIVAEKTYPDLVEYMGKASAIVTNTGGMLSHATIVSRELNIPCVVGTIKATEILKEWMLIKVDGTNGIVYVPVEEDIDKVDVKKEQEELKRHLGNIEKNKNAGLDFVYKEVREEIYNFLLNYKDLNYKVSEKDEEFVNKLCSTIYKKVMEKAIPVAKKSMIKEEFEDWLKTVQKAIDFYKNADSLAKKVIAITWIDKIIRATEI